MLNANNERELAYVVFNEEQDLEEYMHIPPLPTTSALLLSIGVM